MEKLISNLELSVQNLNTYNIFIKVQQDLFMYPYVELLNLCEEYILKNNIEAKRIENNDNFYEKFYLYENKNFSLILIKWNKDCSTKIHDHPDKGCILRVLCGELIEESYTPKLNKVSSVSLKLDKVGYKAGSRVLHKIIAEEESVSLHVYIPGFYTPNYY